MLRSFFFVSGALLLLTLLPLVYVPWLDDHLNLTTDQFGLLASFWLIGAAGFLAFFFFKEKRRGTLWFVLMLWAVLTVAISYPYGRWGEDAAGFPGSWLLLASFVQGGLAPLLTAIFGDFSRRLKPLPSQFAIG